MTRLIIYQQLSDKAKSHQTNMRNLSSGASGGKEQHNGGDGRRSPQPQDEPVYVLYNKWDGLEAEEKYPGEKYRKMAKEESKRRSQLIQRSKDASESGQQAEAKTLRDRAKKHGENQTKYNKLAAKAIFNCRNLGYGNSDYDYSRCDLHYLHVSEALDFVEKHLAQCDARGIHETSFIVGRGNGNRTGISVLGPNVSNFLRERGLSPRFDPTNGGRIRVPLR